MWIRVAFTALARSRRESTSVPSRSNMMRSIGGSSGHLPLASPYHADHGFAVRLAVFELVFLHLALQGVAVNAELFAGGALVAAALLERALDHATFQEFDGLRQEYVALEKMIDQAVKSFFHAVLFPGGVAVPPPCPRPI